MHLRSPFILLLGKSVVIHFYTPNIFEPNKEKKKKQQGQEKISVTGVHTIEDCVATQSPNKKEMKVISCMQPDSEINQHPPYLTMEKLYP